MLGSETIALSFQSEIISLNSYPQLITHPANETKSNL